MSTCLRRREFLASLGGAAAWPLAAHAQQGNRVRRIGVLMTLGSDDPESVDRVTVLEQGLATFRRKIHDFRDDATWPPARQNPPG